MKTILLVDDHKMVRQSLRKLLELEYPQRNIIECQSGTEALDALAQSAVDIMITDIGLPDISGVDLCRDAVAAHSDLKVVCLTMHDDKHIFNRAVRAGASAFILKDDGFQDLKKAITAVEQGEKHWSQEIKNRMVEKMAESEARFESHKSIVNVLSKREIEILTHVISGQTSKEVARDLNISARTVENHRSNIMKKLEVRTSAELIRIAIEAGIEAPKRVS